MGARRNRSRRPRRYGRWILLVLIAAVVTGAAVSYGLRPDDTPVATPARSPEPSPTAIRDLDLSGLPVARAPFCDAVDDRAVTAALGGPVTRTSHYDSGDRVELAPGVTDVAHEYACGFSGESDASAKAWVFAAPVPRDQARRLVREARTARGCRPVTGGPAFGDPTVATSCPGEHDTTAVTFSGLFGGSWLSCQLSLPHQDTADVGVRRATRWCVHVATTMGARP